MPDARLLIVDDEKEIGDYVVSVAEICGYKAEAIARADHFRERFVSWQPSHVILDLQMPDADGVELLGFLADQQCKATIILMSGFDRKVLESARQSGVARGLNVAATLQKPVRAGDLKALLEEVRSVETQPLDAQAIERAMDCGEFWLAYQPKLTLSADVHGGATFRDLIGFEALVRWQHPKRGLINPDLFVPLVESAGLMNRFTDMVMDLAIAQLGEWASKNVDTIVAINISATNLKSPTFTSDLIARCQNRMVSPDRIVIELTETAAMHDAVLAMETLTRLRLRGFHLSIDDFGTGYSSLVQLQRLPFSELKIDRAFVKDCDTSDQSRIIVKTMIDLAHNLGLLSVAEGVENGPILAVLRELGCDMAQGFHIGKPMPPAQAEAWYHAAQQHGVLTADGMLRREMMVS